MDLKKASILVVDDDPDILTTMQLLFKTEAACVVTEQHPGNIPSVISKQQFDVVLLDMNFSASVNTGNEGLYWLSRIRELRPELSVVLITAYADIDLAIRALKEGASDFIIKPWKNQQLVTSLKALLARKSGAQAPQNRTSAWDDKGIIGNSAAMLAVFKKLEKVAPTDANILILGENGTGKDVLARAIHHASLRSAAAFVKVDVGALTESLFESELFGYKKGAFTDAREDRTGRFETAHGGTLFLDEIGNIALQQQAKLLSALQNRQITPLGSNVPVAVDIRLICATNVPFSELVNEQRFRKDLLYRINTVELVIPPLRERTEDIEPLAAYYLSLYGNKYFKPDIRLSHSAKTKLNRYTFPGNVRELQYIMERAVIMADGTVIEPADLLFSSMENALQSSEKGTETNLNKLEKQTILRVIEKNNGNITRAAKELGITRTALYRKLGKHDI